MALLNDRHIAVVAIVEGGSVLAVQSNSASIDYGSYGSWDSPSEAGFTLGFSAGDPSTVTITADEAYWMATGAADWIANDTKSFTATFSPFGPGADDIGTVQIHLRAIPLSFLLVQDGTTELQLPGVASHALSIAAGSGELLFAGSADTKTVTKPAAAAWTASDAEFDLSVTLSGGVDYSSVSSFTTPGSRPVRCLRQLVSDGGSTALTGYTWFQHQSASGTGISTSLPATTAIVTEPAGGVDPVLDSSLRITGITGTPASWTGGDDTTFDLTFGLELLSGSDYLLEASLTSALDLHFRTLVGAGGTVRYEFDVPYDVAASSLDISASDAWSWTGLTVDGGTLVVTSSLTGGDALPVSFQSPLASAATGDYTGAVVRTAGDHPSASFPIRFTITGAGAHVINLQAQGGGMALDDATEGSAYSDNIEATTAAVGQDYTWTLTPLPPLELDDGVDEAGAVVHTLAATEKVVAIETSGMSTIPVGWAAAPDQDVNVAIVETTASGVTVGTGSGIFTLHSVEAPVVDTVPPTVAFLDPSDAPLAAYVPIAAGGSTDWLFKIRVEDAVGFQIQAASLTFRVLGRDGVTAENTLAHDGSAWAWSNPAGIKPVNELSLGTGDATSYDYTGQFALDGSVQYAQMEITVVDMAGLPTNPATRIRRVDVGIPTDVVLLLDYSGSMRTDAQTTSGTPISKWEAAQSAANLFTRIYRDLWHTLSSTPGAADAVNQLSTARFHWDGADNTVVPALAAVSSATEVDEPDPPSANLTPITPALRKGRDELLSAVSGSEWRNRILILLTDGMHNRPSDEELSDVSADIADFTWSDGDPLPDTYLPSVELAAPASIGGEQAGIRIHAVSFAPTAASDIADLQSIIDAFGGTLHATEGEELPESSAALRETFVSLLADVLPVELLTSSGASFAVEDGVDEAVFVVTSGTDTIAASTTSTAPGTTATEAGDLVHDTASGLSFIPVTNPAAGSWTVTGASAGTELFTVVDLQLRTRFGVSGRGVGKPVSVWAEVHHHGEPVSGADIRVDLTRPGESVGTVLTNYAHSGLLARSTATATARATAAATTAMTAATAATATTHKPTPTRRQLLVAAERARDQAFQYVDDALKLVEQSPGRYEAELDGAFTAEDGLYTFDFSAGGKTPAGAAFSRSYSTTNHLAPIPDLDKSAFTWSQGALSNNSSPWQVTVFPRTATGRPLGPGLAPSLGFKYVNAADRKRYGRPETVDQFDGSYTATLNVPRGDAPPKLGLVYERACERPDPGAFVIPERLYSGELRHVRVVLDRIQVRDSKDICLSGKGELAFESVVAPNLNPNRALRRRFPEDGVYRLSDGQSVNVGQVMFEGYVEEGASLDISIGGCEFDWFLLWIREEKLARYRRVLRGDISTWAGSYGPDDEPADPEALNDWKLWYTIEVK